MPEGRYPVPWTADIVSTSWSWYDEIYSTILLLQLDAVLRDQDGDPDGALISARALLHLGSSLGEEPFFYGPEYRSGCRVAAVRAVERSLAQVQPSEEVLVPMQEALTREDAVPLLLAYFRGNRASMDFFLNRVEAGFNRISELSCTPTRGLSAQAETWFGREDALRTHARHLRAMNEAVEIAKLPLDQQYPLYRELRRKWEYFDKVGDGLSLAGYRENGFLRGHVLMRCALVALAAERYRVAHGDWPRSLENLVPDQLAAVPFDPFDGEPLRYRRTENGVVIYSRSDPSRESILGILSDVVFTLWDVAHRRQPPKPPEPATRP
jgi:hypothetical protein